MGAYLAEKTGFDESDGMSERTCASIAFPKTTWPSCQDLASQDDPGDPIPTAQGDLVYHGGKPLNGMAPHKPMQIVHLEDEPEAVYAQSMAEGLYPGMRLQLLEVSPTRIRFWADGREHVLAPIAAANVSVRPLPEAESIDESPLRHLDSLKPGETAAVCGFPRGCALWKRRRLLGPGILPGAKITAEDGQTRAATPWPTASAGRSSPCAAQQARLIDIDYATGETI